MSFLRTSVVTVLAMSATLASAQGTSTSIEERLQQLEAEQAAMKQQLADRDKLIQDLRKELQSQGGAAVHPPVTAAAPAAPGPGQAPQRVDAAVLPPAETQGEDAARKPFTPKVDTWGVYDPGKGFLVGRNEFGQLDISAYGMVRYMSQHDDDQKFTDHLGNERAVDLTQSDVLVLMCVAYFQPITRGELSSFFGKEISRDLIGHLRGAKPVSYTHLTLPTNREV